MWYSTTWRMFGMSTPSPNALVAMSTSSASVRNSCSMRLRSERDRPGVVEADKRRQLRRALAQRACNGHGLLARVHEHHRFLARGYQVGQVVVAAGHVAAGRPGAGCGRSAESNTHTSMGSSRRTAAAHSSSAVAVSASTVGSPSLCTAWPMLGICRRADRRAPGPRDALRRPPRTSTRPDKRNESACHARNSGVVSAMSTLPSARPANACRRSSTVDSPVSVTTVDAEARQRLVAGETPGQQ